MKSKHAGYKQLGLLAEQYVARRLRRHPDWVHICQNYACVGSEIDLIAHHLSQDCLVFLEIKYRKNWRGLDLQDVVPPSKCRALMRGAEHFLAHVDSDFSPFSKRFDLVLVEQGRDSFEITRYLAGFF